MTNTTKRQLFTSLAAFGVLWVPGYIIGWLLPRSFYDPPLLFFPVFVCIAMITYPISLKVSRYVVKRYADPPGEWPRDPTLAATNTTRQILTLLVKVSLLGGLALVAMRLFPGAFQEVLRNLFAWTCITVITVWIGFKVNRYLKRWYPDAPGD